MRVDGTFRQGVGMLAILLGLTLAGLSSYCLYMDELLDVRTKLRTRGVYDEVKKQAPKGDHTWPDEPTDAALAKLQELITISCSPVDAAHVGKPVLLVKCEETESGSTVAGSTASEASAGAKKKTLYNVGTYQVCTHPAGSPECKSKAGSSSSGAAFVEHSVVNEARRVQAPAVATPAVREGDVTVREAEIKESETARHDLSTDGLLAKSPTRHGVPDSLAQVSTLRAADKAYTVFGQLQAGGLIVPLDTRGGPVLYFQEGAKTLVDVMSVVEKPAQRTLPPVAMLALLFLGIVALLLGASEIPIASLPLACCRVPVFSTCSLALINTMALLLAGCLATVMMGSAWAYYSGLLSLPWFAASFTCVLLLLFVRLRCGSDPYEDEA